MLAGYLLNPAERLPAPGLGTGLWQQFVTVVSGHLLVAALVVGVVVTAAALTGLMRYQNSAWLRGSTASSSPGAEAGAGRPASS